MHDRRRLERSYGRRDGAVGRLVEETTRGVRAGGDHGFQAAAAAEGDDRCATGLRFHGQNAEVLFGGEHEGAGAPEFVAERGIVEAPHEGDVGAGGGRHPVAVGAIADHHQLVVGEFPEGRHDVGDALVSHKTRGGHVVGAARHLRIRGEIRGVHRRVDHRARPTVCARNAIGDERRNRHEGGHAIGCPQVPPAQPFQHCAGQPSHHAAVHAGFLQVLLAQVPRIAHGGAAMAQMERIVARPRALGNGMRVGDHHVVGPQIQRGDGQRHERQQGAVVPRDAGDPLQERRARVANAKGSAVGIAEPVYQTEHIGVREHEAHFPQHLLRPGGHHQPFVYKGDLCVAQAQRCGHVRRRNSGGSFGNVGHACIILYCSDCMTRPMRDTFFPSQPPSPLL